MAQLSLSAKLDRTDSNTPWGFRLHGGKDFGAQLSIQRVTPGSLAAKCGLQVGDVITKIGDTPTDQLRHKEAQQHIILGGNNLELFLLRGGSSFRAPGHDSYGYQAAPPQPAYGGGAPYGSPAGQSFRPINPEQGYGQNFNTAAKPFSPSGDTFPVAVNKQYNTPINMYSVDNVMGSLAGQTGAMNLGGQPGPEPIPPWRSGPSGAPAPGPAAPAHRAAPPASRPAAPAGGGGGAWQPKVPTGPRTMKVGKAGAARSLPAGGQGGRIPICNGCGITIRGPFVLALDKTWCPDHFICANPNCRTALIGVGFVEEEGQLFCERDYEQYFAPSCAKCGRAIVGEVVNALRETYHTDCFCCSKCHVCIGSGAFHTEEGKIYCPKDWASMFQTKCYGCSFPIEPGDRWVEALSQNWHSECFNCSTCQVNLEGQSFYAKSGKPYCQKHASAGGRF